MFRVGVRTAPSVIKVCLRETVTLLHLPGLYQPLNSKRPSLRSLMCSASWKCPASLKVLNIEVEKKPNVVQRAQTSYSPGVSRTPWSPNMQDNWRSTPVLPQKPKRYALQIWLEVEVGPGYFLSPEDDSCSMDFALEVLNCTYPGCTGVYLDRAGHMLAFYGRKGGSKAGLIQEVAIEAGHAVTEIPTWMGLTARWKVKCVSLAQANDILAGCKRLEQENRSGSVCTSRNDSPPCTNPLVSQLLLLLSSHGLPYQCLG